MKRTVLIPVLLSIVTMFCAGSALAAESRISLVVDRGVIFVRAGVDGSPLMLFVFDPGAQTFLTQYAQARVKHGATHALTFGPVTIDEPMQTISGDPQQLDPRHDTRLGVIAGTLGGEFLRRYVLRIDYASKTLAVLPPATFTAPHGTALTLSIDRFGVPAVPAQADGRRGLFELDVRAPSSMLFTPLASELGYHVPQRQKKRIASITIGTLTQRNIAVWISNDRDGKFASANPRGLIGNDVLSRYVVTLDYPHRRAYIEPAAHTGTPSRHV